MLYMLTSSCLGTLYDNDTRGLPFYPYQLRGVADIVSGLIPPVYLHYLILAKILPVICNKCQCKRPLLRKMFPLEAEDED